MLKMMLTVPAKSNSAPAEPEPNLDVMEDGLSTKEIYLLTESKSTLLISINVLGRSSPRTTGFPR
jgi:hypothetical protein